MNILAPSLVLPQVNMAKKTRTKPTITFQPDEDVYEMLHQFFEKVGDIHGMQTHIINAALREELPKILEGQLVDVLQRISTDKKPSK